MFRGYWDNRPKNLIALTFGVFLIIFLLGMIFYSGHITGYIGGHKDYNSTQYATHAEKEISETCLLLKPVAKAKCIREVIEATQEHERSERDIVAQESMSLWALWMAVISGLSFFITGVGVYFVRDTLVATKKMNQIASEAFSLERRAWMQPQPFNVAKVDITNPLIHNYQFSMRFKNIGSSPAQNVIIDTKIINARKYGANDDESLKIEFEEVGSDNLMSFNKAVFPNALSNANYNIIFKAKALPNLLRVRFKCIYQDGTSNKVRESSEVYDIAIINNRIQDGDTILERPKISFIQYTELAVAN